MIEGAPELSADGEVRKAENSTPACGSDDPGLDGGEGDLSVL